MSRREMSQKVVKVVNMERERKRPKKGDCTELSCMIN